MKTLWRFQLCQFPCNHFVFQVPTQTWNVPVSGWDIVKETDVRHSEEMYMPFRSNKKDVSQQIACSSKVFLH